ncbi:MAG: cupredoxin domain-containing protein [Acidobacteria bacterium]|nr:cupredoxin domain-containing protein [Acidobacteriota bacterium]
MEFTRVDDKNCGDELVFPKLNIKKTLPVGEPVLVEFTPTESGDLAFQCGMDMMRGKIVVE